MGADERARRRRLSLRARTTFAACAVVAVALVVAVVLQLAFLRRSLTSSVDDAARTRAEVVAGLAHQGTLPRSLQVTGEENALVQVVDAAGHVVAASPNLEGEPAGAAFPAPLGRVTLRTLHGLPIDDTGAFRVAAISVNTPQGRRLTVYAAASLRSVDKSVGALRASFFVGLPVLLLVVGATAWAAISRALHPVESIRRQVADITGRDLGRRVPEPRADDEIGRLAHTMNEMLARLDAFTERQRQFVADASHDLQSPLAASRAELEVALAHPGNTDWAAVARAVLDEHDRLERMVHDLLFLAQVQEGALTVASLPIDFDDLVRDEVERMRLRSRVPIEIGELVPVEVRGSAEQLGRVLRNLLDNAQRHAATRVVVELHSTPGAELIVADDGEGVPADQRERIFERFGRADASRTPASSGAGLGLAIARALVEAHGGQVVLADAPRGARFVVHLPIATVTQPAGHAGIGH
ncbi:MAG: Signal transduction histidine kinase [Actinomycetia bacterium]|nr:Signal transduction histidine kinase [Actinomycetes bacterium]